MLHYRDDPQFCADRPMYLRFQDEEEDEDQPTAEEQQAMDRHQQQQALKAAVSRRLFSCFSSSVSSWFLCFLLVLAVATSLTARARRSADKLSPRPHLLITRPSMKSMMSVGTRTASCPAGLVMLLT